MLVEKVSVYSNRGMIQRLPRSSHCCKQGFGLTGVLSRVGAPYTNTVSSVPYLQQTCY